MSEEQGDSPHEGMSRAQLVAELERLRRDNTALGQQVKLLVKTEQRLYRSQNQVDLQLGRVRALSDYVLSCPSLPTATEILVGANALLADQFHVDRVHTLEVVIEGDTMQLRSATPTIVSVCAKERRLIDDLVEPLFVKGVDPQPLRGMVDALDRLDRDGGVVAETEDAAVIPVRVVGRTAWLMVTRRFSGRAKNLFRDVPSLPHAPFLMLLSGHVERALENARLHRDLQLQAAEVEQSNRKLKVSLEDLARTQHQLIEASKMEALGRLAGGVAHDFNNLLTVILGTAGLMEDDPRLDSGLREDCRAMIQAAERASDLTRQMLTFGRRRAGTVQRFELHPLLTELSRLLRRVIGEDVALELRLEAGYDELQADPAQLEQVMMNLVLNARDAMPGGGEVIVETAVGRPKDDPSGPLQMLLSVADSGRGMDAQTQARVFEPFFTTKDVGEGSGMGLATVYGIIQQLGGQVSIDSAPGQGARFEVSLPLADQDLVETATTEASTRITVLVVEDEASIRRLVVRILGRQGYEVLAASDGEAGLRRFDERGGVDLVLTDVVMPGLDGVGMVRQLRQRRPDLPVLFMSGYSGDHRPSIEGTDQSMLLDKPFTPAQLVERVEQVLAVGGAARRAL
ncbi:MAG: response regulator [Deltaproteobacteria bacterium]|nr:response regulator [Deltaproteobacteria bacterium]